MEIVVGHFQKGTANALIEAVDDAYGAFKAWRDMDYRERIKIMRRAGRAY